MYLKERRKHAHEVFVKRYAPGFQLISGSFSLNWIPLQGFAPLDRFCCEGEAPLPTETERVEAEEGGL